MQYFIKEHNGKIIGKLPMGPSVNKSTFNRRKGGRGKTQEYKDFKRCVEYTYLASKDKPTIEGTEWLEVTYLYHFPIYNKNGTIKTKDTANFEKVLSDCLAVIPGFEDKKIKRIIQEKIDSTENTLTFIIKEI